MKKLLAVILICFSLSVHAQQDGLGVGIIIGEPTGLSLKKFAGNNAFDAAIAWSIPNDFFHVHVDYLQHSYYISDNLPFFIGIGAALRFANDPTLLARVPLGISFLFYGSFEAFAEVVPALQVLPKTDFEMMGGAGVRYYFN